MALAYKAMGAGVPGPQVLATFRDAVSDLTATGTNQATAYHVTTALASFSTVDSGTGARLDIQGAPGDSQTIFNGGANTLSVYPPAGAQINNLGSNNPASLAVNTTCEFQCMSTTRWAAILSA